MQRVRAGVVRHEVVGITDAAQQTGAATNSSHLLHFRRRADCLEAATTHICTLQYPEYFAAVLVAHHQLRHQGRYHAGTTTDDVNTGIIDYWPTAVQFLTSEDWATLRRATIKDKKECLNTSTYLCAESPPNPQ